MRLQHRLALFGGMVATLLAWGDQPHGQRLATRSSDLEGAGARGERVRVIVQADAAALPAIRLRHRGALRRELSGAVVLEVSRAELDALARDPAVAHISGDLPVRANMAISNKVTLATKVWQGNRVRQDEAARAHRRADPLVDRFSLPGGADRAAPP